jgi:HNH endonuclease
MRKLTEQQFIALVIERYVPEPNSGCWLWTRAINNGYGIVRHHGRNHFAHRVIYEALIGPIPPGLQIDHKCRNPACGNPDHLEPVTGRINRLRAPNTVSAVNAAKTHCVNGHPLSGDNLHIPAVIRPRGSRRVCKTCHRARSRKSYLKRMEMAQ